MSKSLFFTVLMGLCVLARPSAARAADDDVPGATITQTVDVSDLWHTVRHRADQDAAASGEVPNRYFVLAPTVGSKPTTGVTLGLNTNLAFFTGDPGATHISVLSGGVRVSQKGQVLSGARYAVYTSGDRWFVQGDNRLSWSSLNTYALSTVASPLGTENVKFDALRLYETAYHRVRPGMFYGLGVAINAHGNVRPGDGTLAPWDESAYVAYNEAHGFASDHQTSTGTSASFMYDTRDSSINAHRGVLATTTYRTFFSALGGDSTWQELTYDARTYRPLTHDGRRKLAFWTLGDFVTGGVAPYWDLPAIAADGRSARGYGEGRYRGERMMYGEVEYRSGLTSNGLLGFVTFLNVTTISSVDEHERLFGSYAPGAGGGLRVLLNKRSGTNLCADYGFGKAGSRGFYLSIQEAF